MSMYSEPDYSRYYEQDDEEGSAPSHGESGTCAVCGGEIGYIEETKTLPGGGYEVLNGRWVHVSHPEDGHDAELGGPA